MSKLERLENIAIRSIADKLAGALTECQKRLKARQNCSGGWWNDRGIYEICNEVDGMVPTALNMWKRHKSNL